MTVCLMLHGVGPVPAHVLEDEIPYWISRERFLDVVELSRESDARLTFDDGNDTDFTEVLPVLSAAGLKASFFIPSDRIGTPGYLSEDQIRSLHCAGMEIGSHGCAHVRWTECCDAEIAADVARSVERLSAIIGAPVRTVAIPFGFCDRRVLGILRRLGIERAYSSFRGPETENAWLVRRDCIMADMSRDDIRDIVTHDPHPADRAITFLKIWRRAGSAALWNA
jgi:peptidoglycan/xylan/chitin deacetylase (PgdA/CDA1 family)